jgi:cation:H+ antiporter
LKKPVPDLSSQPFWLQLTLFASATIIVSIAGSRLARYAVAFSQRLNLAHGFVGMLLLGAITSLPEMSGVSTGAAYGNAALSVNNLLGSSAINVLMLAVADATAGCDALPGTWSSPPSHPQLDSGRACDCCNRGGR